MEEAPINPDEPQKQDKISLPKKLWETVDDVKIDDQKGVLVDLPLDYEADDAGPEDMPAAQIETTYQAETTGGAVSAGDVLAERYKTAPEDSRVKSIDERRREFEQRQKLAEAELDTEASEVEVEGSEQVIELPKSETEVIPEDMPETYFERRHEIKDEPAQDGPVVNAITDDQAMTDQALGLVATSAIVDDNPDNFYREEQLALRGPFSDFAALTKGLYWQAIKGGFWAAIVILILAAIIGVVS